MIRTQVYLPEDLYTQIQIHAGKSGQPAAALIRKYLSLGMDRTINKKTAGEALLELAKHASKSGPRDLSTNHDQYLYGQD